MASTQKKNATDAAMAAEAEAHGLSLRHWGEVLSDKERDFYRVIRPLRKAAYKVSQHLHRIEESLAEHDRALRALGGGLDLHPDFQRGHVWTQEQKVAFMESLLKGVANVCIKFNCPSWDTMGPTQGDLPAHTLVCVDGLQRLTAIREFVAGKFKVFGRYLASDLAETTFDLRRHFIEFEVFNIKNRRDLLGFYLSLNAGGTPHAPEEIARVRALWEEAPPPPPAPERIAERAPASESGAPQSNTRRPRRQ